VPAPPTPANARAPAHQERSRATAERIVAAALDLLGRRRIDELTVAEVAAHAGVSIGGFYARFPGGKDALFQYLGEEVFEEIVGQVREHLSRSATEGLGARQVIERYVGLGVSAFRRHRRVLQQVSLRSRTSLDAAFRARVLALNVELHDTFRARLRERTSELGHPDPEAALSIALTAVSGAMREYVLFQELRPQFDPVEDGRLVAELTDLFCRYVRITP
jgi:AcrR family transcriptional regulator